MGPRAWALYTRWDDESRWGLRIVVGDHATARELVRGLLAGRRDTRLVPHRLHVRIVRTRARAALPVLGREPGEPAAVPPVPPS